MGLDEASRVLSVATNTANLVGYLRIGELRDMMDGFEKQSGQGGSAEKVVLPIWGRLQERMKEDAQ